MPYNKHKQLLKIELLEAVLICIFLAIGIINFNFYDWWHEYTRAHESWKLDEVSAILFAIMTTGTILAIRHYFLLRAVVEDLSKANEQIKEQSERQVHSDKLSALGHLSAGLAHEVNNALQPASGLGEFIVKELESKGSLKHKEYMEIILSSTKHAQNIIQNVLFFSQSKGSEKENHKALDVLLTSIEFAKSIMPTTIFFEHIIKDGESLEEAILYCNQTEITQIFINLFKNAANAMDEKGTITLGIEKAPMPRKESLTCIKISVSDTGRGMDEETQNKIFNPFFSTKDPSEGTGLGLSTVHGFISLHGGTINLESKVGKGTTFYIYLPLKQKMRTD